MSEMQGTIRKGFLTKSAVYVCSCCKDGKISSLSLGRIFHVFLKGGGGGRD